SFGKLFSGKKAEKASPKIARLVEPTKTNKAAKSAKTATLSPPLDVACSGNASILVSQTGDTSPDNALGAPDATEAQLWETGDVMVLQLADLLDAGATLNIRWRKDITGATIPSVNVEESEDGVIFTAVSGSPFTVSATTLFDENFTSEAAVQYIRVTTANGGNLDFDAIFYVNEPCTLPTGPGYPDCVNNTEIGGILFLDANGNATQDNEEQGASGVTVKAFDADDLPASPSATTTSDPDGTYLLTGLTGGTTYRIEISWSDAWLESSVAGGTTVQFVAAGVCDANAGLLYPAAFCQDAPDIMVPCYVNGDPLGGGTAGTMDVLVQVPYTASGSTPSPTHLLSGVDLGTVWGSALQRETQQLFLSSFLKRHCGLGTMGLGGIYKVDMSLGTP
ncbi:MAG: SdrD B-like domain-containing protein, partial [Bacteroidota bacterium]